MTKKKKARTRLGKPSTGLIVRPRVQRFKIADPDGMLDTKVAKLGELNDLAYTGGIGVRELVLTAKEQAAILAAVNRHDVAIKPDGTVYLPHIHYTRWLIAAFGPTGWSISPVGAAKRIENLMIIPHVLYIHGVPVAFAFGAAEYQEKNRRQTYDDVLESTTAYALRRCCKRIGMALELWDKRWVHAFLEAEGVQVKTDDGLRWRRRDDPMLPNEHPGRGTTKAPKVHEGEVVDPPAGSDGNDREPISQEQRLRLVKAWRSAGRNDNDVLLWLKKKYGYHGTEKIKRFDYTRIERELMARGALTLPGDE